VAGGVTLVTTPIVRRVAIWRGWLVAPDERRVHVKPTPAIGGVAMFLGLLAGVAVAYRQPSLRPVFASSEMVGVVIAATIIFAVGLIDDLHPISPPAKVAGLVLAGIVLSVAGATMQFFRLPFLGYISLDTSADFVPLVTVLWLLIMANAINLIDGLDGLAAGIVAIASGTFFLYGHRLDTQGLLNTATSVGGAANIGPLVAIIVLGICLGFLPHNFNPARIFMGDSGALMLGGLMAVATSVVGGRVDEPFSGRTYFFFAPLFIPLVILGVPLLDAVFAVVRRATRRRSVSGADKVHLHHRLMRLGHGQRRSVLILWLWTAILSGLVLYPTYTGEGNGLVPFGIAGLVLALYTVLHPQVRRQRDELL
jgi:UDP-GlcNAc:undecaprenyl-phosphate GlcNAc-1-phosphate transferase